MADEVLKGCKRYTVERVISPSLYLMTDHERGRCYKREMERFEYLLSRAVEKLSDTGKVSVGEIVAMKDERGFHRGLITDVFNRHSKTVYWLLLVDYGNIIEMTHRDIYLIKNEELKRKKLSAFEVSLNGIQPVAVELEYNNNFLSGIFSKKVSTNWSSTAVRFVKDIIKKHPSVFVKIGEIKERIIYGDIYYIEECDKFPVSLSQKLCTEGFAVLNDISHLNTLNNPQGGSDFNLDKKTVEDPVSGEMQHFEMLESLRLGNKESSNIKSLNDSSDSGISPKHVSQGKSSCSSSIGSVFQNESPEMCPEESINSGSDTYSSSRILCKKCNSITSPTLSCCNSLRKDDGYIEHRQNDSAENVSTNIFRIIQRSVELFNKHKENERIALTKPKCNFY